RRFWTHSVACAYIADRLLSRKLLKLDAEIPFDRYWVAALLHDIGKLVIGFFAWEYYREVVESVHRRESSFRREEERLEHLLTHEYVGRLVLINAGAPRDTIEVAATHNTPPGQPRPLVCLVHMANNLAKQLGFGVIPEAESRYSASVLMALGLKRSDADRLAKTLGDEAAADVEDIVGRCLNGG
ncbi:MAG: HDOD domain-containing protein, partial [Gemmatimonadota bacterium]